MSSYPSAALQVKPPESPLESLLRVQSLKNQQGQGQLQQQSIQAGQLENQQRQMDLDSQKAIMRAYTEANGDTEKATTLAAKYGAKPGDVIKLKQAGIQQQQDALALVNAKGARALQEADLMKGAHDTIASAAPEERPIVYQQTVAGLQKAGIDVSQIPPQYPGDEAFKFIGANLQSHKALVEDAVKGAEAAKNNAQAKADRYKVVNGTLMDLGGDTPTPVTPQNADDWNKLVDSIVPVKGNAALNLRTKAQVSFYAKQGNMEAAQKALTEAGNQIGAIEKETDPRVVASKLNIAGAEARMQQAIKDGSAEDAGKMLASGQVAPSEVAARSNPSFLVKANQAALRIDPTYNAQKSEAEFKVAGSAANVPFFGSAKSLTDKGGTLDQLADAAKAIPQHDIPIFNTIDDAMKAASGSGPVAKYASILLGVSDDYSKVMGGGTGSDASRAQAFQLAKMSASPEARAAAIEGIRGAVGSQINSRIGSNKVLRNMYGAQQEAGGAITVTDPKGGVHSFPDQAAADAFKKAAHIQ